MMQRSPAPTQPHAGQPSPNSRWSVPGCEALRKQPRFAGLRRDAGNQRWRKHPRFAAPWSDSGSQALRKLPRFAGLQSDAGNQSWGPLRFAELWQESSGQALSEQALLLAAFSAGAGLFSWPFAKHLLEALSLYFDAIFFVLGGPFP